MKKKMQRKALEDLGKGILVSWDGVRGRKGRVMLRRAGIQQRHVGQRSFEKKENALT